LGVYFKQKLNATNIIYSDFPVRLELSGSDDCSILHASTGKLEEAFTCFGSDET
jgi:hypothetical protein